MTFIIDHLIAILVGATLLGALLFMQLRGQQSSIETTIRHRTETQTASFLSTLTRDLENTRTQSQIQSGLGTWSQDSVSTYTTRAFGIHGNSTHTHWLEFVTLADPSAGVASPLMAVSYRTVPTGDSVEVGGVLQPAMRVERFVWEPGMADWEQRGGSASNVTGFSVTATRPDGSVLTNNRSGTSPAKIAIVLTAAEDGVGQKTGDQAATTRTNATRQALTVRIANANSTGDASAVLPPGGPFTIPLFPGIAPYTPPPPTTTTPGGTTTTTVPPGGSSGSGTTTTTPGTTTTPIDVSGVTL